MSRTTLMAVGLFVAMTQAITAEDKKPIADKPVAIVRVSFSVDEFDPSNPAKASIKCVVKNNSDNALEVPVGYDGTSIQLWSSRTLRLWRRKGKDQVKPVWVEPSKERT